jgi:hypothetical protein
MKYAYLTSEQQAKLIEERLALIEAEHYQHEINRLVGVELMKTATDSQLAEAEQIVAQEEASQKLLDSAHRAAVTTLDELRSQDGSRPEAT